MRLVWTCPATADRDEIRAYIRRHNPSAANTLDALFSQKAHRLAQYPHMGRLGRAPGTRELVAHPNYILVYDTKGDTVRILRVLHTARQWP